MEQRPIISIIMPCYNGVGYLKRSIASIYAQTFKNFELIVVDDGSSDNSPTLLAELAKINDTMHIIHQSNGGVSAARNTGLRAVRGEFIAFLDADDTWDPGFLMKLYQVLQVLPDAVIAYCGWQNTGLEANRCKPYIPPDYENSNKIETFLKGCPWPIHAALTRKSAIDAIQGFNQNLQLSEDYEMWLKIASFHKITLVPEVLAYYHHQQQGEQATNNRLRVALNHWQVQRTFLTDNPDIAERLGTKKIADLTDGELLHRAYVSYWHRDLNTAHALFRKALALHYFSRKDLKYLLPALLPLNLYQTLILKFSK